MTQGTCLRMPYDRETQWIYLVECYDLYPGTYESEPPKLRPVERQQ